MVHNKNIEKLTGRKGKKNVDKPWMNRIVKISAKGRSIYKIVKGKNGLSKNEIILHSKTMYQLGITFDCEVKINGTHPLFGRFMYYWFNLDDATRMAFRIGIGGLIFGFLSLPSLVISWYHFIKMLLG